MAREILTGDAHRSGVDKGIPALFIRNDVLANLSAGVVDGDMTLGQVDADGALYVVDETLEALITAGNVDLAAMEVLLGTIDADTGAIKTAIELIDHQTDSDVGAPTANTQRVVQAVDVDLNSDLPDQSVKHTHTTAGAGEQVAGDTAFSSGAVLCVRGIDTWVAVGDTELQAEGQDIKYPAGVPFLVLLKSGDTALWLDAATGGEVSIHQVS